MFVIAYFDFGSVQRITSDPVGHVLPGGSAEPGLKSDAVAETAKSHLALAERYLSLDDLIADQRAAGYLKIGSFGDHWPGQVEEISVDNDSISFLRQDGTRHKYKGFDGYRLKMVRLSAAGKETIVIFRSTGKR